MGKEIKIWYDEEGDYLEVLFERKAILQRDFQMMLSWRRLMTKATFSVFPY